MQLRLRIDRTPYDSARAWTRALKIKKFKVHRHIRQQVAKVINVHTERNLHNARNMQI